MGHNGAAAVGLCVLVVLAGCGSLLGDESVVTPSPTGTDLDSTSGAGPAADESGGSVSTRGDGRFEVTVTPGAGPLKRPPSPGEIASEQSEPVLVVANNRPETYEVTVWLLPDTVSNLSVTFANESMRTVSFSETQVMFVYEQLLGFESTVVDVAPASGPVLAHDTMVLEPRGTAVHPLPTDRRNATLLVVVRTTGPDGFIVDMVTLDHCDGVIDEYHLSLDPGHGAEGGVSCEATPE